MLLALLALVPQDLDALAARLAAEDVEVRVDAEKAILDLPGRLLPATLEALGRRAEPEARALEDRIRVNASWIGALPGSIREIREVADSVGKPGRPDSHVTARVLQAFAELPAGEAPRRLLGLLDDPAEGARVFALTALRVFPPADPAPLLPHLRDVRTSGLAAEILIVMRAEAAVPLAVDLFVAEGGGMLGAARILEAFGAGRQAERVTRAMREKAGLLVWGIRILRATGPAAEPQLIALAPELSFPRRREVAEALSLIGGERSAGLVRDIAADLPPDEQLELLWNSGDRAGADAALIRHARASDLDRLAYAPLAPAVRARIADFGRPTPALLNLLGAVGGPEDLPLLKKQGAQEAVDRLGVPPRALPALELRDAPRVPEGRVALAFDLPGRREAIRGLAARADADAVATLVRLLDDPAPLPDGTRIWHWAMSGLEMATGVKTEGTSTAAQRAFWRNRR